MLFDMLRGITEAHNMLDISDKVLSPLSLLSFVEKKKRMRRVVLEYLDCSPELGCFHEMKG